MLKRCSGFSKGAEPREEATEWKTKNKDRGFSN